MSRPKPTVDLGYPTEAHGRIPAFTNVEEEAAFWDTHDFTDFAEESTPVQLTVGQELAERLTLRLDQMERILRSPADIDLVRHVDAAHAINFSHPETLARIVDAYLRGRPLTDLVDDDRIINYVENEQAAERLRAGAIESPRL